MEKGKLIVSGDTLELNNPNGTGHLDDLLAVETLASSSKITVSDLGKLLNYDFEDGVYQIRISEDGLYSLWLIFICSWGCDTCAYAVGMLIGKHKIFPVLSPKKSLEGCIGGVLGAALLGGLYGYFFV